MASTQRVAHRPTHLWLRAEECSMCVFVCVCVRSWRTVSERINRSVPWPTGVFPFELFFLLYQVHGHLCVCVHVIQFTCIQSIIRLQVTNKSWISDTDFCFMWMHLCEVWILKLSICASLTFIWTPKYFWYNSGSYSIALKFWCTP